MRVLLALASLVLFANPAMAVEHILVKWKKTGTCEVVTRLPLWGNHWVELGHYPSKSEAERALAQERKIRACPAKSAKKADKLVKDHRGPLAPAVRK